MEKGISVTCLGVHSILLVVSCNKEPLLFVPQVYKDGEDDDDDDDDDEDARRRRCICCRDE